MHREAEIAYAAGLALAHQEFHHSVVHRAAAPVVPVADDMDQIVVDVVGLEILEGVVVHLYGALEGRIAGLVGELGRKEVAVAGMARKRDARSSLGLAL